MMLPISAGLPDSFGARRPADVGRRIRDRLAAFFAPSLPNGTPNPDVDFGFYLTAEDEVDGRLAPVEVARDGDRVFVAGAGRVYEIRREMQRPAARTGRGSGDQGTGLTGLIAPMPGRIRKTLVRTGDVVERGQVVLVLEAMKMEHAIRAPRDGTVTRLDHAEGDLVEAGTVLAEIG